jgi:WD40 repeat protein
VAFVDSFGSILLWDLKAERSTARFGERVTALDFSKDGKQLAAVSRDGVLSLWDVSSAQPFGSQFKLGDERFWGVRFDDDGKRIAVGGDAVVLVWDATTHKPVAPFRHEQKDRIWSLAFSADGRVLISGGNKSLRLWSLDGTWIAQDIPVAPFAGLSRANVALSPDGALLAFRDGDRGVAIWDLARRQPARQRLMRDKGLVSSIAFSPDQRILAVGAGDGTIMLWDVNTGEALGRPLSGHAEDDVEAIAFGPDGRTLVSIGGEKMIVWDFSTDGWKQAACRIANRNLTPEEWTRNFGAAAYRATCRF